MAWFERTLIPEIYGEILKNIRPELKEEFEKKTLERVFQESDIYKALYFLWQAQYFDELATLVYCHFHVLDGRHYRLLRPVADILKETDPRAATLMYRKLLESVLQKAQSILDHEVAGSISIPETITATAIFMAMAKRIQKPAFSFP